VQVQPHSLINSLIKAAIAEFDEGFSDYYSSDTESLVTRSLRFDIVHKAVWLDDLAQQLLPNENEQQGSPSSISSTCTLFMKLPIGSTRPSIKVELQICSDAGDAEDGWLGITLRYDEDDEQSDAPLDAVDEDGMVLVRGIKGDVEVLFSPHKGYYHADKRCKMGAYASELRAAVRDGFRLEATVAAFLWEGHASIDSLLPVHATDGTAGFQQMLADTQFTDAVVRAAGREWAVHRVVLAAASPVFQAMLGNASMVEARTAVIELRDVESAEAVDLLIKHCYGTELRVPLVMLPALPALGRRHMIRSGLAWQLTVTLATNLAEAEALTELIPTACQLHPAINSAHLFYQAVRKSAKISCCPAFLGWPQACVLEVVRRNPDPLSAFQFALAWMQHGQRQQQQQMEEGCNTSGVWLQLLEAMNWAAATPSDLHQIRQSSTGLLLPGLDSRLRDAFNLLCLCLDADGAQLVSINKQLHLDHEAASQRAAALQREVDGLTAQLAAARMRDADGEVAMGGISSSWWFICAVCAFKQICADVLCCAVLCCAVLCCAVLCCAVLCCAVLCCAVLCCAVLCCAVLCCAVLCCAVLCCAVPCCASL